jgi:hypothetical protein
LLLTGVFLFASAPGICQGVATLQAPENNPVSETSSPKGETATPTDLVAEIPVAPDISAKGDSAANSALRENDGSGATAEVKTKQPVESEIIWEGTASYGNYNLYAIDDMTKIYTSGVEYDRHVWGYFMKAQMDYVAEVLPLFLLVEPAKSDYYGNPLTGNRKILPGLGLTPVGLRMMWRSNKQHFKPYVLIKGGMVGFTQKALSPNASYENFTMQSGFGVQTRLTQRVDLRIGLWGDFHVSNAIVVPTDPGTDVMNANWGICYHLGQPRK